MIYDIRVYFKGDDLLNIGPLHAPKLLIEVRVVEHHRIPFDAQHAIAWLIDTKFPQQPLPDVHALIVALARPPCIDLESQSSLASASCLLPRDGRGGTPHRLHPCAGKPRNDTATERECCGAATADSRYAGCCPSEPGDRPQDEHVQWHVAKALTEQQHEHAKTCDAGSRTRKTTDECGNGNPAQPRHENHGGRSHADHSRENCRPGEKQRIQQP